jgi:hypothetical protein
MDAAPAITADTPSTRLPPPAGFTHPLDFPVTSARTPEELRAQVRDNLRHLGVNVLDVGARVSPAYS